jgi:hypothetical protein
MISDLEDERIATQGTVIRITEAGIINLKSQIVNLKYTWGCMVLTA